MLVQQRLPCFSLGYWLEKIYEGSVFANAKGNLTNCLEKQLPLILADFPLPLFLVVPAINPKNDKIGMQIIHGENFFEALYRFYQGELYVCSEDICKMNKYNASLPKQLSWNTLPDTARVQILYTKVYVTKLLSTEERYFSSAQIEQLSKIDFGF